MQGRRRRWGNGDGDRRDRDISAREACADGTGYGGDLSAVEEGAGLGREEGGDGVAFEGAGESYAAADGPCCIIVNFSS